MFDKLKIWYQTNKKTVVTVALVVVGLLLVKKYLIKPKR